MLALADARRPTAPGSSSPAAWPSATATSWPRPCPRSIAGRPASACPVVTLGRGRGPGPRSSRCPASTCSTCPGPAAARPGPTSRSPRAATAPAGSAPSRRFRGPQRSRPLDAILDEVDQLGGRGRARRPGPGRPTAGTRAWGSGPSCPWCRRSAARVRRVRLLYLYPSDLSDELIDAICATGVPYFDLSLQHVSRPLLRRMRRWGDGDRFLRRIEDIRRREPDAAFRSNFIVGYPGETEADHDELLALRRAGPARLVRLLRLLGRRTARTPPASTARCPRRWSTSAWPSCASSRTASPRARRDELIGTDGRGAGRRAGRRLAPTGRRPRSTASSTSRTGWPWYVPRCEVVDALGPDLVRSLPTPWTSRCDRPVRSRRALRTPRRPGHVGQRRHRAARVSCRPCSSS